MKVLIGCECSGTVLRAFLERGHDAWSCDLKPIEQPGLANRHIQDDVRRVMRMEDWNLLAVFHPPCTRLCNSGVRWFTEPPTNPPSSCEGDEAEQWATMTREERLDLLWIHLDRGAALFEDVLNYDAIPHRAVENPVMHGHAKQRIAFRGIKPFFVQPWHFARSMADDDPDFEKKQTGWWCHNLPKLRRTGALTNEQGKLARDSVHKASPGENRGAERSVFFPGMAAACADQWGEYALECQMEAA